MTAIITCGETRQSLAAVRALGRAQIPVAVGAKTRPSLAMWSRYASSTFLTENSHEQARLFAEQLGEELKARYAACALVSSDDAFWALSRYRELLPISARRILPPHYSVVRALDHIALHDFAKSLDIACAPLVRIPENATFNEVRELLNELPFPMLIRPVIPWIEREGGTQQVNGRLVVRSKEHLKSALEKKAALKNGFLVSAYTTVRALSYFGVAEKGQVLAEGFQERLNELEPYNEIATLAVTINPVPSIRRASHELLSALQWQGPFKIEFAKDQRGNYRLISLIGRLWGSLQLAIKAHVNIPLICYRLALGTLAADILHNARPNVRMRWLVGDAAAKLSNPVNIMYGIKDFLSRFTSADIFGRHTRKNKVITCYDVLDFEDPMPFLFELQNKTWKRAFSEREAD